MGLDVHDVVLALLQIDLADEGFEVLVADPTFVKVVPTLIVDAEHLIAFFFRVGL